MSGYGTYIDEVSKDITSTVQGMKCQPIIFAGSGLSIRYFGGPNWEELLEELVDQCPEVDYSIEYYLQRDDTLPEIGSILAESYYDWAWGDGMDQFADKLRDRDYSSDIFVKYQISQYFETNTPDSLDVIEDSRLDQELELLSEIHPHSIITTNYDRSLELIFPDYEPIVGEEILRSPHESIGEIMKIHGSISEPESLVFTDEDYEGFNQRKKYLSSKLLTFFAEHPVLIAGYSVEDANVRKILSDIDRILSPHDGIIENIYFLQWDPEISERDSFPREKEIEVRDGETVRVKYIATKNFDWVFNAFSSGGTIEGVNLKLLRSVMANTYDIIREKAPREEVRINYESLERAARSEDTLGTLFGVSTLDNPPDLTLMYRYGLTEVAEELGYGHWTPANDLIQQIEGETGINIKESDNLYHIDVAYNRDYSTHRYSDAAVELLEKVDAGEEYDLGDLEHETEESVSV